MTTALTAPGDTELPGRVRASLTAGRHLLRRHWLFTVFLVGGTTLRALAWAAYQPAFFYSDSVDYLKNTGHWPGTSWHPPGYPLVLDLLDYGHHLAVVTAVQHLLVVAAAAAIYLLLLRLGCSRIVAALATAPVLLDAYQIDIEQYILAESVFEALIVAAIVVLLWPSRHRVQRTVVRSVVAGLLLAFAALVRLDAVGLVVPFAGWLAWTASARRRPSSSCQRDSSDIRAVPLTRPGWVRAWAPAVAGVVTFAIPIAVFAMLRAGGGHGATVTGEGAIWMYGRVAPFANCPADGIPTSERPLCPTAPQAAAHGSVWFQNADDSPVRVYLASHPGDTPTVEAFARRVILHQPLDYAGTVFTDFVKQFRPTRLQTDHDPDVSVWLFPSDHLYVTVNNPDPRPLLAQYGHGDARIDVGIATFLHDYQTFGFLTGLVPAVLLVGSTTVLVVRRRHPLAPALWLWLSAAVVVMLVPAATVLFSWRYVLPTLLLYPPAGAVAWTMWRRA